MPKIDPEVINKIYPSPRTADEARAERSERQSLLDSRRSAHPRLQITFIVPEEVLSDYEHGETNSRKSQLY